MTSKVYVGTLSIVGMALIMMLLFFLFGCAFNPPYLRTIEPQAATVTLSQPPDAAYQCAVTVFRKQSQVAHLASDPQTRIATGQWHYAANMVIAVEPHQPGSLVNIQGSVPRNKVTTGEFDEVPTLASLIKAACS